VRVRKGVLGTLATVAIVGAGCASASSTSAAIATATAGSEASRVVAGSMSPAATTGSLLVLGDGVQGGIGLWQFEAPSKWTSLVAAKSATAVSATANGFVLVVGQTIELRVSSDPAKATAAIGLKWPNVAPADPIVAVDRAPGGKVALVTSDGTKSAYYVIAGDGTASVMKPAPSQSFTPLVAWLDDSRLLVLSTDTDQVSRLAVVDTASGTLTPIKTVAGISSFALSADKMTLAAVMSGDVFAAPVSAWLAGIQPLKVASVDSSMVVWGLALDQTGSRLAALAGTTSADGHVGDIHDLGYAKSGATWTQAFDAAAPMTTPRSQVWIS
jgi:hypothetical protein